MSKHFDSELANQLATKYQQGDEEAFNQLYKMMQYPIGCIVKPFKGKFKGDAQEAYGVANLGLVKAIKNYREEEGYAFITFANKVIKGEILHYLRDNDIIRIPSATKRLNAAIQEFIDTYQNENNKPPTEEEIISEFAGKFVYNSRGDAVSAKYVKKSMNLKRVESLDKRTNGEKTDTYKSTIASTENIEKQAERRFILQEIYNQLDPEMRQVFIEHLLKGKTQREVANQLGVNRMFVTRKVEKIRKIARLVIWGDDRNVPWDLPKLDRLTDTQRNVFIMKVIEGKRDKEIYATLGIKRGSICNIVNQAKRHLVTYE